MDWQFVVVIILAQTAGLMLLIGVLFHILMGALLYPVPRKTDGLLPKPSPSAALKRKTAALIAEDRIKRASHERIVHFDLSDPHGRPDWLAKHLSVSEAYAQALLVGFPVMSKA